MFAKVLKFKGVIWFSNLSLLVNNKESLRLIGDYTSADYEENIQNM